MNLLDKIIYKHEKLNRKSYCRDSHYSRKFIHNNLLLFSERYCENESTSAGAHYNNEICFYLKIIYENFSRVKNLCIYL